MRSWLKRRVLLPALAGFVWIAALLGCGRDAAVTPTKQPSPPSPVQPAVAVEPPKVQENLPEPEAAEPAPPAASEAISRIDTADDANSKTEAPAADETTPPERIAVLTAGGPLLIDVRITIDGRPHGQIFKERIQQVLDAADTNGDRKATWSELAENEEFLKAEQVTNPNSSDARKKMWTERFDLNRNREVEPNEAAAWLGRDTGRAAAALSLRSRRSYYAIPALASRVWQLVDADDNRRLTSDEIDAAPDRFLSFDANDDRIITSPELAPLREQLERTMRPGMSTSRPQSYEVRHAALRLDPESDVGQWDYLLADLYAPRHNIGPHSFPALPRLFEQLDTNGDQQLFGDELAGLLTIAPHVELAIAFEEPDNEHRGKARLEVCKHEPEINVVAQPAENRVALALGNIRINISADDLATAQSGYRSANGPQPERAEIRAMVHDDVDALFEALDQDADGRLGERELITSPARIRELDANGDGQITNAELPTAMIVAFLRSEQPTERSFYVPEALATPHSNGDAPAWFAGADVNSDGEISRREFLGTLDQFKKLDVDDNGFISIDEIGSEAPSTQ